MHDDIQDVVSLEVSSLVTELNMERLQNLAGEQGGTIQSELELALNAARTMANTFEVSKEKSKDGKEALNIGRDQLTTGRFTPYWTRDDKGNIAVQPLVEYDTYDKHSNGVLKGGWYITPREQNKESVLGPLPCLFPSPLIVNSMVLRVRIIT